MRTARRRFVPRLISLLALLAAAKSAPACQCGVIPGPRQAAAQSRMVFAGIVTEVGGISVKYVTGGGERSVRAKAIEFHVQRLWKGLPAPSAELISGLGNCDFKFAVGRAYLVYAEEREEVKGRLTALICKPTKLYKEAEAAGDLKELGPGTSVRNQAPR